MFRTKDLVLFFVVVLFLVAAIGVTIVDRSETKVPDYIVTDTVPEIGVVEVTTEISAQDSLSREQRLQDLRQKIKDSELVMISEPMEEDFIDSTQLEGSINHLLAPLKCENYTEPLVVNWPVSGVKSDFVEGARQYFTETHATTSPTSTIALTHRVPLLTLQTQFLPFGNKTCLANDVIGVALDGSLIRNNNTNLYKLFSNETLVGYALDGFPIYGASTNITDDCGGRIEFGQYRYELSLDRSEMINCFAGVPETIGS